MINRVGTVSIFVEDQDRAKAFYTEKLGMECTADNEMWPGADARWLSVAPPGAETQIVLYKFDENWEHYRETFGKSQSLTLQCEDIDETFRVYKERGVEFLGEPETQFWGRFVMMVDCEGNTLILVQVAN
ncbi:MAG: VOC family protein [Chloroflexi bacterium]|nr:VOC family protein [Chloroflexota bacterium]